ncbi:MAG: acyl-CoA dehydratase activase-related protein, partial [Myxococcota bacterium]|nr:acyl-CoA dehydratase activase-related protein [Myxococcota bacterium]
RRASFKEDAENVLGVDGGSTTTKVALVDTKSFEIVASHYGRTHGNPVAALKECLRQVKAQVGDAKPRIVLAATTGSSRELLGTFLQTAGVYNEIIAHTVGTTWFDDKIDTIFEIGGQDAKYVSLHNAVPIDYAMNEACSAGTGSFLEESAQGDLNIGSAKDIGPIAMKAQAPLRFGQHCSAFINSDIRKAIQQGAGSANIVAGLVCSVVANYLNRVVGNRRIGERIALQGGVACNPAVPLAFAQMTRKPIVVPPEPELMGCFGVAVLAQRKCDEGLLSRNDDALFELDEILQRELVEKATFTCKHCDDRCEIRMLEVGGSKYPFGGRCSRYTSLRKRKQSAPSKSQESQDSAAIDYVEERRRMCFEDFVPQESDFIPRSPRVVGVPLALSVHSLWPLYSWFFHSLGVRAVLSEGISRAGLTRVESTYCYPAELAHGALAHLLEQGIDTVFVPLFRDMPSMEQELVHACVCPLTQGLPFYLRQAFDLNDSKLLRPLVSFKSGWNDSREEFAQVAVQLGLEAELGRLAYDRAISEYQRYRKALAQRGKAILAEIQAQPEKRFVALLGRPYNAYSRDANMGIPRKLLSQGVSVVPFDMIYAADEEIFPNMYWYYGQMDMKAVRQVKRMPNVYLTWVTNFSCAPDSFMLHYLRWMMGQKPYLVLEIDSHTADAGIDTRIEAFLDIVASYQRAGLQPEGTRFQGRYQLHFKKEYLDVIDQRTGRRFDIRAPEVKLVFPSMGELSASALAAVARKQGIHATHLPVPTAATTQLAREVASGKECIPALLVLGSVLEFFRHHEPNREGEVFLVFVPSTIGPCRTGQYFVFYERLFEDLGWENVVVLVLGSENSYREMGPTFNRDVWWALLTADVLGDIRGALELLAEEPVSALACFDRCYEDVLGALERGGRALDRVLRSTAKALAAIPKKGTVEGLRKVLVVGEIYVRRDDFSVDELKRYLIGQGILPKVTDVTEWIHYTDYSRKLLMDEELRRGGLRKAWRSGLLREEGLYYVEKAYKDWVNHRIRGIFVKTGLLPEAPHDMKQIVDVASEHFIPPELESEATVSSGVAAVAMGDGYSGIAIVAPFACLPGRVIEGVFAPWARKRGFPVISLESDGQPYPPSTMARMEVFAPNVARFEHRP